MGERTLTVKIIGDATSAKKAFGQLDNSTTQTESKFVKFGAVAKVAMVGAGLAAIKFGKDSVDAFAESRKVSAQTEAVLKSTGGAANVSAAEIGKLASQLQNLSGVEDEAIQKGQNMLLTFTNLKNEAGAGNDVFNQATRTLLDMSVALGTDASTSAVQLGKALNDPIKGISALSRVGVTFTDEQKNMIRTLVESGDVMGAQKIILAELNREFGGSAKAAGDAQTPVERLKLKMGDLQEKVGAFLIPALEKLSNILIGIINVVSNLNPVVVGAIAVIGALLGAVFAISSAMKAWTAIQVALYAVMFANPVGLVVAGVVALAAAVVVAYKNSETFRGVVQGAFSVVATAAGAVRRAIEAVVDAIQDAIRLVQKLARAIPNLPSLPKGINKVPGIPFLAHGGPVARGRPYVVGEEGPELFIPGQNGQIIPNPGTTGSIPRQGSSSQAPVVVNNYISAPNYVGDKSELSRYMIEELRRYTGRGGTLGIA